ncbi:MAG: sensor histidine kinase KdpD [Gemmatimonadaceae bacterium]|nr:sensor histidine kinase KdpD [Gemmatimonadaceae bacterium]
MNDSLRRPDPDALLAQLAIPPVGQARGRLKVFVGAAPGVGKTFTMLETARLRQQEGRDVVIGVVETHGRSDTEAMMRGFEIIPRRSYEHRGSRLEEFDLDAALVRQPALVLMDELAHSNAPGAAHQKRWQDIDALLTAGIDVYSTVNVQHLDSLNDVVAGITGVQVRETVPDAVIDEADEVELVDVSPEVLEERLRQGKVYGSGQADRALEHFFRRGNLIALRELALRRTAERVDAQMRRWRDSAGVAVAWPATESVLVCIGPSDTATALVRAARRLAGELKAKWTALYVEQPGDATLPAERREYVQSALRLAESLGGQAMQVAGHNVADEARAIASRINATRILVGRSHRWWAGVFPGLSIPGRLTTRASTVDVIIAGLPASELAAVSTRDSSFGNSATVRASSSAREYLVASGWVTAITIAGLLIRDRVTEINMVMALLLVLVFNATRYGRGPTLLATVIAVLSFDILFVPPYGTLAVSDIRFILTFVVMFVVGVVMSSLTRRVREQAAAAREREARTSRLYALTGDLSVARASSDVARVSLRHLSDLAGGPVAWLEPHAAGEGMQIIATHPASSWPVEELAVARWSFDRQQPAGAGTATLPAARARYLPLTTNGRPLGVIGLVMGISQNLETPTERDLLGVMLDQIALAFDRTVLADQARAAHLDAEAERLRNALLSSLSHDLRTPLGSVEGAASTLLQTESLGADQRQELATTILDESQRMTRLVGNLLDMVRVESGSLQVQRDWHVLDEIVSGAVLRVETRLGDRMLSVQLPPTLPLVALDDVLIQQVLVNLLENALRHTPAGSAIEISAIADNREVVVTVADRGPGVPEEDSQRIFSKFERGQTSASGIGLGLSICAGIVQAHGGRIWVEPRQGGGACFRFALPMLSPPPIVEPELLVET